MARMTADEAMPAGFPDARAARSSDPLDTIVAVFWGNVEQKPDTIILRHKRLGVWRGVTWSELGDRVRRFGAGLIASGVKKGDAVCILSLNRPEWLIADLALLSIGALSIGIYPTEPPSQIDALLTDC